MNILITSGSIVETIDKVYYIGQNSDTSVAAIIGEEFSKQSFVDNVHFLYGEKSRFPWESRSSNDQKFFFEEWEEKVRLYPISDLAHLKSTVDTICEEQNIDLVVHLMSIPNYGHTTVHLLKHQEDAIQFVRKLEKNFGFTAHISESTENPVSSLPPSTHGKMKTGYKQALLEQLPQEKFLSYLLEKSKGAKVISGKFEFGVNDADLVKFASDSLAKNGSHYVIASDLEAHKNGDEEGYFLISKDGKTSKRLDDIDLAAELVTLFQL